jgi:phosphopantetheinyl transferase
VPSGCVDVWLADIDAAGQSLDALERRFSLLTSDEHAHARSLLPAQGLQSTRTRVALRVLLASRLGPAFARTPFQRSSAGKASLADSGLAFSLAHSGNVALLGLSTDGPVGVDIETRIRVEVHPERRRAIEAAAMALARGVPLPERGDTPRFVQAWTRLEALAKATGTGIGPLLARLGLQGPASALSGRPMPDIRPLLSAEGCPLRIDDLRLDCAAAVAGPSTADFMLRNLPIALNELTDLSGL